MQTVKHNTVKAMFRAHEEREKASKNAIRVLQVSHSCKPTMPTNIVQEYDQTSATAPLQFFFVSLPFKSSTPRIEM